MTEEHLQAQHFFLWDNDARSFKRIALAVLFFSSVVELEYL